MSFSGGLESGGTVLSAACKRSMTCELLPGPRPNLGPDPPKRERKHWRGLLWDRHADANMGDKDTNNKSGTMSRSTINKYLNTYGLSVHSEQG